MRFLVFKLAGRGQDLSTDAVLSRFFPLGPTASCGEPPTVPYAKVFGKKQLRYETNTRVRYYCEEGHVQQLDPVIRCLPSGQWEEPQVTCLPKVEGCIWLALITQAVYIFTQILTKYNLNFYSI